MKETGEPLLSVPLCISASEPISPVQYIQISIPVDVHYREVNTLYLQTWWYHRTEPVPLDDSWGWSQDKLFLLQEIIRGLALESNVIKVKSTIIPYGIDVFKSNTIPKQQLLEGLDIRGIIYQKDKNHKVAHLWYAVHMQRTIQGEIMEMYSTRQITWKWSLNCACAVIHRAKILQNRNDPYFCTVRTARHILCNLGRPGTPGRLVTLLFIMAYSNIPKKSVWSRYSLWY